MAKIFRGANSQAFAAMTTEGFEFSRQLAHEQGMDLGLVLLGEKEDNPPAAIVLALPPGAVLPRHSHNTQRMEVLIKGSIITPDGEELLPGDASRSGPGECYGPLTAGPEGCLTLEIFANMSGLAPQGDEAGENAETVAHIASLTEANTAS